MYHEIHIRTLFGREIVFPLPFDFQKNLIDGYAIAQGIQILKNIPEQECRDCIVFISITEKGR